MLDSRLYLPEAWFDDSHKLLWERCDIPESTEFRTKLQLAIEMTQETVKNNDFNFKWVGCDGDFGCDSDFRKGLPVSTLFFADVHCNQRIFLKHPQ